MERDSTLIGLESFERMTYVFFFPLECHWLVVSVIYLGIVQEGDCFPIRRVAS